MDRKNVFYGLVSDLANLTSQFHEKNKSTTNKLNSLLNDLNSLNYSEEIIVLEQDIINKLFTSLTEIPVKEETLVVKSCCLISTIITKTNIKLNESLFGILIEWQIKCLCENRSVTYDVLSCLRTLFKNYPSYCGNNWRKILLSNKLLFNILDRSVNNKMTKNYDTNSNSEIFMAAILCIQSLILNNDEDKLTDEEAEILSNTGEKILDTFYQDKIILNNPIQSIVVFTTVLQILYKIIYVNKLWMNDNLGRLLGFARAFICYGLSNVIQLKPQKIVISQQTLSELQVNVTENKGGKKLKLRKPNALNKKRRNDKNKNQESKKEIMDNSFGNSNVNIDFEFNHFCSVNKTSDSDFSDSDTGVIQSEIQKEAKLRLSAISLIGLIAKNSEKKYLYGYWHALFPSETKIPMKSNLLCCVLHDPNMKNRIAALQVASVLLFGSKSYLYQAENSKKAPKSFMPFSISLGNMVISIYELLTQAISTEISFPVLAQLLKCLSILIQNTPFHRLRSGIVTNFVRYVRTLINHKDPSIQVAALMVMEFLISVQDPTDEISQCIGLSRNALNSIQQNKNRLTNLGVEEIVDVDLNEELLDSDCENSYNKSQSSSCTSDKNPSEIFWLLHIVLQNLETINEREKIFRAPSTVRIGSLQVLSAMALHFQLIKNHLDSIATALNTCLCDSTLEIKLFVSKCLDIIGHSINIYLLENDKNDECEISACQHFWTHLLPTTMKIIQDQEQSPVLKALLCDFLSNLGFHIFERLPDNVGIQIISLLTGIGCNEESTVRAAAVRALAIYVTFPSLRNNLNFIDNTAELTIQLMKDSNLYTRIKVSWALGNISDALVSNNDDSQANKISNNLLEQMLSVASEAANDSAKVRSNAVRTLGSLLRLITKNHLSVDKWRMLCMNAIEKLTFCMTAVGNAKVKWNSCYAIGNLMRNKVLFESYEDFNWRKIVFPSLCDVIVDNPNFKVRINGAAAFTVVDKRESFGPYLVHIWSSLLSAIEHSDYLVDFNEYKHRDNLQEQLCLTISHVIKIATANDFLSFKSELVPKLEITKQIWIRVINRILPESAALLFSSIIHLESVLATDITNEQRNCIQVIMSCFIQSNQEL